MSDKENVNISIESEVAMETTDSHVTTDQLPNIDVMEKSGTKLTEDEEATKNTVGAGYDSVPGKDSNTGLKGENVVVENAESYRDRPVDVTDSDLDLNQPVMPAEVEGLPGNNETVSVSVGDTDAGMPVPVSDDPCTSSVIEETDLTEDELLGARKQTFSAEKLVEKLGYRRMSLQIFQKMRDTFGSEECEYCGRLFFSRMDYEPHVKTHTGMHWLFFCFF